MKPKGSLPRSEQPSTCLYTEPHDLVHAVYKIYGNIFPSLCFKRWFSFMLPFEILYAFVFTTYIADALLTSSLLIWSCHLYLVWSTKFEGSVSFSQTTCYSHPLQSKTFLSILFSWTLSAYVHTLIWENTHTHTHTHTLGLFTWDVSGMISFCVGPCDYQRWNMFTRDRSSVRCRFPFFRHY